jgi:hypothetical protein
MRFTLFQAYNDKNLIHFSVLRNMTLFFKRSAALRKQLKWDLHYLVFNFRACIISEIFLNFS